MTFSKNIKALVVAVCTTTLALSAAWAGAAVLRRAAMSHSHQQPTDDSWFTSTTVASHEEVVHGRALFLDSCAHCHGADARGDEGPDLHAVQVSDRYISTIVRRGIKGEMPSFAKKLGAPEINALTAYIRSLE